MKRTVWLTASVEWLLCAAFDSVNSDLKFSVFFPKQSPKPAENRGFRDAGIIDGMPFTAAARVESGESEPGIAAKSHSDRLKTPLARFSAVGIAGLERIGFGKRPAVYGT